MHSQVVHRGAAALAGLTLLGALAGCGAGPETAPDAEPLVTSAPPAPATALPPRPRDVSMDGLNPCALVTPEMRTQAGVTSHGEPTPGDTAGVTSCGWDNFPAHPTTALDVNVVTNQDTAGFLLLPDSTATTVAGFGAVDSPDSEAGPDHSCVVRVDVAPSQGLWVSSYNTLGDDDTATHARMCQRAHAVAEAIMANLLATRR